MADLVNIAEMCARLRKTRRGVGHSYPTEHDGVPCKTVVPYGNMMNDAADMLERVRNDVLEEAAGFLGAMLEDEPADVAGIALLCAMDAIRALKTPVAKEGER